MGEMAVQTPDNPQVEKKAACVVHGLRMNKTMSF